jgi:adenylosuccinate lyase
MERWAVEFRHLQRTEVLEAEEPFTKGQRAQAPCRTNAIPSLGNA